MSNYDYAQVGGDLHPEPAPQWVIAPGYPTVPDASYWQRWYVVEPIIHRTEVSVLPPDSRDEDGKTWRDREPLF